MITGGIRDKGARTVPVTTHTSSHDQPLFKRNTITVRITVRRTAVRKKVNPTTTTMGPLSSGVSS